jgi:uncharacterized protein YhbP (UPF0306 family)
MGCETKYKLMNERIEAFIEGQTVATVCCVDPNDNTPYCFSCFYSYDKEKQLLYFKTSSSSHHAGIIAMNPIVAGAIQPDKLNRLAIKGLQFTGRMVEENDPLASAASSVYHKKYPFALAMPGEVWTIELRTMKMTDNTLAFGKKLIWEKDQIETA